MKEVWKNINDNYTISNNGIVKRLPRTVKQCSKNGLISDRHLPCKILKQQISNHGYRVVSINGKRKYIHRLLMESFVENTDNKRTVNHIDGDKLNNSLDNLEWATDKENLNHAKRTGLNMDFGETHHNAKLKYVDVQNIRFMSSLGYRNCDLAKEYGVDGSVISDIKLNKMWNYGVRLQA